MAKADVLEQLAEAALILALRSLARDSVNALRGLTGTTSGRDDLVRQAVTAQRFRWREATRRYFDAYDDIHRRVTG